MKLRLLLILLLIAFNSYAQAVFNHKLKLDTIFFLEGIDDFTSHLDSYILDLYSYGNDLYFFSPIQKRTSGSDSLVFLRINITNGNQNYFSVITPALDLRTDYPNSLKNFCLDDQSFHIGYSGNNLFGSFVRDIKNDCRFSFFTPLNGIFYKRIFCYQSSIFLFNSYRTIELKSDWNYIYKYDLRKHNFTATTYLDFKHPEFSYFEPNNWFDFYKGKSAYSQTTKYEISLYDTALALDRVLERKDVPGWVNFAPTHLLDSAIKINDNGGNISVVMGYLRKYIGKIARVEKVYFINKSELFVSYYVPNTDQASERFTVTQKVDIWDLENYRLKYQGMNVKEFSFDQRVSDSYFMPSEIITRNNFPLFFSDGIIQFFPESNKMVVIRVGGRYEKYLDVPFNELAAQEDRYLEKNAMLVQVFVFSLNL